MQGYLCSLILLVQKEILFHLISQIEEIKSHFKKKSYFMLHFNRNTTSYLKLLIILSSSLTNSELTFPCGGIDHQFIFPFLHFLKNQNEYCKKLVSFQEIFFEKQSSPREIIRDQNVLCQQKSSINLFMHSLEISLNIQVCWRLIYFINLKCTSKLVVIIFHFDDKLSVIMEKLLKLADQNYQELILRSYLFFAMLY